MKTNRLLSILVALTLAMQATILYRQYRASSPSVPTRVREAPGGTSFDLSGVPVKGSEKAKLILIEFSDYECPFCARHATQVAPKLAQEFVESEKIRSAFVNNPLASHPNAKLLATAAICAAEQGRYWEMYESLFVSKPKGKAEIEPLVQKLNLDSVKFSQCLEVSAEPAKQIERDMQKAKEFGLSVTPAFAIGFVDAQGQVAVQKFIVGAVSLETFRTTISDLLAKVP